MLITTSCMNNEWTNEWTNVSLLAKLPSPSGAQRRHQLTCGCGCKMVKTRQLILKGCVRGREGGGPSPPRSWQCPEILPIEFTSSPSPRQQVPGAGLRVAHSRTSAGWPSGPRTNRCPPSATKPTPGGSCRDALISHSALYPPGRREARCSNSAQLECWTGANNQVRFMRKEPPDLFPRAGVKRSREYSIWCRSELDASQL